MITAGTLSEIKQPRSLWWTRSVAVRWWPLVIILLTGGWLCSKDITNESSALARGDTARYLMNGVFFLDLARDIPELKASGLVNWSQRYYARYPALSIGHHPIVLPMAEAVSYAIFGISVSSARLVVLLFFLAALTACYALVRELYDDLTASLATAIVATNSSIVNFGRSILSELPALAICLAAGYCLLMYQKTDRRRHLVLLATLIVVGIYAKQLTAFLIPLAAIHLGLTRGWRHLTSRPVVIAAVVGALLILPLLIVTLRLSPWNVKLAVSVASGAQHPIGPVGLFLKTVSYQELGPTAVIAGLAALLAILRRDRRSLFFGLWILLVFGQLYWFTGSVSPGRYAIYWIPAFAGLAAGIVTHVSKREVRWAVALLILTIAVRQGVAAAHRPAPRSTGYDEAAAYVVAAAKGDSVLFSGPVDTGLFVFGIRRHDPLRKLVVLRADKVLATSRMVRMVDRITRPDEIYAALNRYGTAFVVVEEIPSRSPALELLRSELKSPRFAERRRWAMESSDPQLTGTPLVVYEYLEATAADPDAMLDMQMPVVGQSLKLRFGDLLDQSGRKR